ncbi:MAG: helix-turn-helix domain-containing protein [Candidatus Riflebacteria bacterium]|nr:helix-turn-helix domain-containing protein [Candidatus Riflebacteria bacterium]
MNGRCLNEEQLIELYYAENDSVDARTHLAGCQTCQNAFANICNELVEIDMQVPDGGHRAVSEALCMISRQQQAPANDTIMTIDEVAQWLKVSYHNVNNMLHLLPHFIIDGQIRFNRRLLENHLFKNRAEAEKKAPDQPSLRPIALKRVV